MQKQTGDANIIIVGGGLAGLAAATYLARGGLAVTLFEKARLLGGRSITETRNGFSFNLGPHALYRRGRAAQVLRELGVHYGGKPPALAGGYAIRQGRKQTLPMGMVSLLTTGWLGVSAKFELARLLGALARLDAAAIQGLSVREWLAQSLRQPQARQLIEAFFRLNTYANDPERLSAGVALAQFQLGVTSGVLYLDGGWQTLVEGLRAAAAQAGVRLVVGARVAQVEHNGAVQAVRLADGERLAATAVVIAASPREACALIDKGEQTALSRWAQSAIPVCAACLEIALQSLPQPGALFALGIDRPLYYSLHSAVAKLTPGNGALIHLAKYLGAEMAEAKTVEGELEGALDLLQPGWRKVVAERRFLPNLTVSHALATAAQGGLAGRPAAAMAEIKGLYLAGDWVGDEGLLADASLASAKSAATAILRQHCLQALAA
jgi:phytoene dehydrogenase-like protein